MSDVFAALAGRSAAGDINARIVLDFQLPRVLLCWLVGAALAVSGGVLQGLIRNPLAAPDIIGVTKGAGLRRHAPDRRHPRRVDRGHRAGRVRRRRHRRGHGLPVRLPRAARAPARIALVGIAVSAAFEAGIRFLLVENPLNVSASLIWLTGSLFGRTMTAVWEILPWVVILVPVILLASRRLDTLALGDDLAAGLGEPVEKTRLTLLMIAVALAAAAVSVAGTIGFVGLIAPHMARRIFGARHLIMLPAAGLMGVLLMLVADALGRSLAPPLEIPAGLVTAVVGGPYFLYLLAKSGK